LEARPIFKLKLSQTDQFLEIAGWAGLLILWITTILIYMKLPEIIPTHFNAAGKVDDHGDKMTIMILPGISTLLFLGLTFLSRYPHHFNYPSAITERNVVNEYTNANRVIRVLKLIIVCIMVLLVVMISLSAKGDSSNMPFWFLPLMLGVLLIPLAYFTYKAIKAK